MALGLDFKKQNEGIGMTKSIIVKTQFAGVHNWPEAPDVVKFLREPHRHIFKIKVIIPINKDRELEFFMVKKIIDEFISNKFWWAYGEIAELKSTSCEELAEKIGRWLIEQCDFPRVSVIVMEDGENGSKVTLP
jgi:hypothetical protein